MEFLKNLRVKTGKSKKEMAVLLGISESTYSKIENDSYDIKYSMAVKIAEIFFLNPDDIFLEYYKTKIN